MARTEDTGAMPAPFREMFRRAKAGVREIANARYIGWSDPPPASPKTMTIVGTDERGRRIRVTLEEIPADDTA